MSFLAYVNGSSIAPIGGLITAQNREREIHLFSLIINYKVLGLNTAGVAGGNAEGEAEGGALLPQRLCTSTKHKAALPDT